MLSRLGGACAQGRTESCDGLYGLPTDANFLLFLVIPLLPSSTNLKNAEVLKSWWRFGSGSVNIARVLLSTGNSVIKLINFLSGQQEQGRLKILVT